ASVFNLLPAFRVKAANISILHEPLQFYNALIRGIAGARRRIVLASLYLGCGAHERRLVQSMVSALDAAGSPTRQRPLRVRVLLDAARGTRGSPLNSSTAMLRPLCAAAERRCHGNVWSNRADVRVSFYRCPSLLAALLPERINEVVGLQHMKIYLFDDSVILSGANLSRDYFTDRQDRYLLIRDAPRLCDFLEKLVDCVSDASEQLGSDGCLSQPARPPGQWLGDRVNRLIAEFATSQDCSGESDSTVYAMVQMGPMGVCDDAYATQRLLHQLPQLRQAGQHQLHLASGYFNLTDDFTEALLTAPQQLRVLCASPAANSFYKSTGPSYFIPAAYSQLERQFLAAAAKLRRPAAEAAQPSLLAEYARPGWTFHAKGLWLGDRAGQRVGLTLVGSSNFGYRTRLRDLEVQFGLATDCDRLAARLAEERDGLFQHGQPVSMATLNAADRRAPAWLRLAMPAFKTYC
ncbi:hypothetical protein BOX15_Mlig002985g1, partial [Macrostomum lignano]